eukprot:TRINITY_DN4235_c0_g2_i3.p1 TRINITY_DN4235_c0_g2~~TRINITY_DN4235_c0_g2_i3.p1  ORF type:complete len:403 (-),score=49.22 TRINITY_DN4235_c0_g2_i3:591-1799(-)
MVIICRMLSLSNQSSRSDFLLIGQIKMLFAVVFLCQARKAYYIYIKLLIHPTGKDMSDIKKCFTDKNWSWRHDNAECMALFDSSGDAYSLTRVKSNSLRSVFLLKKAYEGGFFIKHDHPLSLFKRLRTGLKNKIRSEYDSAMLLQKYSIPVVEYLDWARNGSDALLVSRAEHDCVSGKKYWHDLIADDESRKIFLNKLSLLVKSFIDAGLHHPDFHSGNILVKTDSADILVVDPYGVSKIRKWSCAKRLDLCKVFVDFRGELSEYDIEKSMIGSGIAGTAKEARELWIKAVELEEREVYNGWTKRCTQILSGTSKFCTMIVSGGREFFIRHSVCYEPPPGMEDFKSETLGAGREYSTAEAERLWLGSFKRQLLRQHQDDVPLAWERDGGKSVLYYAYTERKK